MNTDPENDQTAGSGTASPGSLQQASGSSDESLEKSWQLRLYVAGQTPNSVRAIANLRKICEEHLHGRYELKVIDLYQQPELALRAQIVAVPTLIRELPEPIRQIIGDMSNVERVLIGLELLHR